MRAKPFSKSECDASCRNDVSGVLPIDREKKRRLLATLDSQDREIAALRGLIDTLSFCYDQPVSDLALMVRANAERDAREKS